MPNPTASQRERAAQLFEDVERLLSRFGGVGLGISVTGCVARGCVNSARETMKEGREAFEKFLAGEGE